MAILVGVLLWLGMMGGYDRFDQSCANVFCKDLGPFNLGSCQIGWSGYLGKSFESFIFNTTIFVKSGGTIIDFSIFQAFRRGTRGQSSMDRIRRSLTFLLCKRNMFIVYNCIGNCCHAHDVCGVNLRW